MYAYTNALDDKTNTIEFAQQYAEKKTVQLNV